MFSSVVFVYLNDLERRRHIKLDFLLISMNCGQCSTCVAGDIDFRTEILMYTDVKHVAGVADFSHSWHWTRTSKKLHIYWLPIRINRSIQRPRERERGHGQVRQDTCR